MQNNKKITVIVLTILALAIPHFADARAGGGKSMGSRGMRTYSAPSTYKAQPIQRSTTTAPKPQQQGMNAGQQGLNQQPSVAGFGGGSPFFRGLAGGFLGAGIASMLFGHAGYAAGGVGGGAMSGGSALGGFLQILMIGGLIYFAFRLFRGSSVSSRAYNTNMNGFANNFSTSNYAQADADNSTPVLITNTDKEYFEQLLQKIQHHWSEGDLAKLRQFVTPEMLQYFSEELSVNASRGLANKVENVVLERADIVESWHEFELDYASATLQWSANDYMVCLDKNPDDNNYVESGSKTEKVLVDEVWTFVRSAGGNWLLSAIQQV